MGISKVVARIYGCSNQSLCVPGTLGLKEMCPFLFVFVQKFAHMCIDDNPA